MEFKRNLTVVTRLEAPFTMACVFLPQTPDFDQVCPEGGINFDVFRALMTILGFSYTVIQAEDGSSGYQDQNGTWHGMVAQLARGEADMTATLIGVTDVRLQITDFSVPASYYMSGFIIQTPLPPDLMAHPWTFLVAPFSPNQWAYLLGCMLLVAVTILLANSVRNRSFSVRGIADHLFEVVRSLLLQPEFSLRNNRYDSVRIVYGPFIISAFFITSFYTSFLTSSLLVSRQPTDPFTGLDQFAQLVYESKYTIINDDTPSNPAYRPLNKTEWTEPAEQIQIAYKWNPPLFVPKNSYGLIVDMISKNKSLVYAGSYFQLLEIASNSCSVKVIVDTYSHPNWLSFAFPKGSKLQHLISSTLVREDTSVDTFLQRLYKRYSKQRDCPRFEQSDSIYQAFGLKEMQGPFWALLMGMAMAVTILICEQAVCVKRSVRLLMQKSHSEEIESTRATTQPSGRLVSGRVRTTKCMNPVILVTGDTELRSRNKVENQLRLKRSISPSASVSRVYLSDI